MLSKGWTPSDVRYVTQGLSMGGWLCRALMIFDPELRGTKGAVNDPRRALGLDNLCGYNGGVGQDNQDPELVVVGVHHNGLGNTLYQYAAARLLARAVGATYASSLISEREGAMDMRIPPHSREAWEAFCDIFEPQDLRLSRRLGATLAMNGPPGRLDAKCAPLVPSDGEYIANGTVLYGDRPADKRRRRPKETLRELVALLVARRAGRNDTLALRCVKLIGYFQDYALLRGVMPLIRSWLPVRRRDLSEEPGPHDVVVHIRLCQSSYHVYTYHSLENYYGPILDKIVSHSNGEQKVVKLITTCALDKPGVARDLVRRYGATLAQPVVRGKATGSAAADFIYMTRATTLVICESTFSWWAAALSNATDIHAPALSTIVPAWDDPRYIFHDLARLRFWGKFKNDRIIYSMRLSNQSSSGETHITAHYDDQHKRRSHQSLRDPHNKRRSPTAHRSRSLVKAKHILNPTQNPDIVRPAYSVDLAAPNSFSLDDNELWGRRNGRDSLLQNRDRVVDFR